MFHLRSDDYVLLILSWFVLQNLAQVWQFGESRKVLPALMQYHKLLWSENRLKWLFIIFPAIILLTATGWFCLRSFIPENERQSLWILAGACLMSFFFSLFRLLKATRQMEIHRQDGQRLLAVAENEL